MALVLEMPAGVATDSAPVESPPLADAHADAPLDPRQQAADMLDSPGGADGEVIDGEFEIADEDSPPFDTCNPTGTTPDSVPAGSLETPPRPAPETEPPAETPIETSAATRRMEMASLTRQVADLTLEILEQEELLERTKDKIKSLNEERDEFARELRAVQNGGWYQPRLPMEGKSDSAANADAETIAAHVLTPATNGEAWRSAPISELGLTPKLTEVLAEAGAATIGQLEDLRSQISQAKAVWPKGIGVGKQTVIEDAVIDWLTKHRDSAAFAKAGEMLGLTPPAPEVTADPPADKPAKKGRKPKAEKAADEKPAEEPADPTDATPSAPGEPAKPKGKGGRKKKGDKDGDVLKQEAFIPVVDPTADMTDEQFAAYVTNRAKEINDGSENCLAQKDEQDRYWKSGKEAYGQDFKLIECPLVPGLPMDDWIRGWLAAEVLAKWPDAEETEGEKVEKARKSEATAGQGVAGTKLYSLDDL